LGVYNAVWFDAHVEDLINLGFARAIEASSKLGQQAEDLWVRVTFHRCEKVSITHVSVEKDRCTIMWLDSGEVQLPSHMLSIDLAEISYEECIFIAWLADIMINTFNSLLQSSPDQLFWGTCVDAIELKVRAL
jgi:hypothetical protein